MSPLPTLAMRPLVSSSVLYVDLLVRISTTTTTPSSAGMLSVATRTSLPRPQAWVTEAILSTTTVRISLTSRTGMKHARQRNDLRKAERILRRPFAVGFAIHALGHGHQRVRRLDAFDEQTTRPEQHVDLARDARLR